MEPCIRVCYTVLVPGVVDDDPHDVGSALGIQISAVWIHRAVLPYSEHETLHVNHQDRVVGRSTTSVTALHGYTLGVLVTSIESTRCNATT